MTYEVMQTVSLLFRWLTLQACARFIGTYQDQALQAKEDLHAPSESFMDVSVKGSGCLSQVSPNSRTAHNLTSKVEFKALIKSHLAGGRHAPVRQFS